jgi:dipeptidyl aminopeptidase/acylaminoacyl peptidase
MIESIVAPYGSWKSPLTSERIVSESIKLGQISLCGDEVYWVESRPTEGGRSAITCLHPNGSREILTPAPLNVRTRVHEYGGAPYLIANGVIYFSNFSDQRLYQQSPGQSPEPITPEGSLFYADGIYDHTHNRLIHIREDQTDAGHEAINTIVSIPLDQDGKSHPGSVLVSGNDFYASPRLNSNGTQLAWITWNHPNMPWDGTELWIADIREDGTLHHARCIAGGLEESIFQPEWSPDGILHFVSDRTGWWNLYRWKEEQAQPLCPMDAEFGLPQWSFGQRLYDFETSSSIVCAYTQKGMWNLARLDTTNGNLETFDLPYTDVGNILVQGSTALLTASSPSIPHSIIQFDLQTHEVKTLRQAVDFEMDKKFVSIPTTIEYPSQDGHMAHAFYYPPHNADFHAPQGERPPLMVKSHGGPTGATSTACNLMIQYWTSRGFAVLDVNYGGSTGYGRAYRERLNDQWGIVDVDDCASAVQYVIEQGKADPARVTITGGSAGGYTTLCALTFRDCFTGGSSYYGVSDLEALVCDTHKFESRYLDRLIGQYPAQKDLYDQRSPIYFTDKLSCPLILFQGLEDKVVPPNQAERMFQAVKSKGLPVAYVAFEGEQHGFRKPENVKQVLDNELYFYSKVFGFTPAEGEEPVHIENLQ